MIFILTNYNMSEQGSASVEVGVGPASQTRTPFIVLNIHEVMLSIIQVLLDEGASQYEGQLYILTRLKFLIELCTFL